MFSKQETFNLVLNRLREQGEPSMTGDKDLCLYRGERGLKCAAGHLIPNNLYDKSLEGLSADSPEVKEILLNLGHDIPLCVALQDIHDNWDVPEWERKWRELASEEGLNYSAQEKAVGP